MTTKDNPLLCFVHVPKTGGTSLQVVLENPTRNGHPEARPVFHIGHPGDAARFLSLPSADQDRHLGVFGHMPFGIDRHVGRPVRYITFLRDPIERTLSSYAHVLRQLDHPHHAEAAGLGIAWTALPSNLQSTALADYDFAGPPGGDGGFWWNGAPFRSLGDRLAQAKRNLDRCDFIGLTESYDDDLQALRGIEGFVLDIPSRAHREQVGGNRLKAQALTDLQIQQIALANRADRELYDYAVELRRQWGGPVRPAGWTRSGETARRPAPAPDVWRAQPLAFHSHVERRPLIGFPISVATPAAPWDYGASSDLIDVAGPATIRVRMAVKTGLVGVGLISEDYGTIVVEGEGAAPGSQLHEVRLDYDPAFGPVRLLIRNHGDPGRAGAADIVALDVLHHAQPTQQGQ
jgi:hypothetical protein